MTISAYNHWAGRWEIIRSHYESIPDLVQTADTISLISEETEQVRQTVCDSTMISREEMLYFDIIIIGHQAVMLDCKLL